MQYERQGNVISVDFTTPRESAEPTVNHDGDSVLTNLALRRVVREIRSNPNSRSDCDAATAQYLIDLAHKD